MKKLTLTLLALVPLLLALRPNFTPKPEDDGWVELINGKDFTGWRANENKGTWKVVDGMFQADDKRSHLFYEGEHLKDGFKNFELEVQVRTFILANSGIYFHTEYQEEGWPRKGMEIQVNNTHIGENDYIELKKMASLYGVRNIYKAYAKDDEWMTVKARVESDRVQVWLNGVKTVDYVQPEHTIPTMKRLSKGTFCLQGHDVLSKMQYKSFRVRRLPDDARSGLTAPTFGVWHDTMMAMQSRQFAFIDLNPKGDFSAKELTAYEYATGINMALVKSPKKAMKLATVKGLPLFTGIKVGSKNFTSQDNALADYFIGESVDLPSAKALLQSGRIQIWSDKGRSLATDQAASLLNIAKQNNVAIEIDNEAKQPSIEVLKMAKAKGCKFTFAGLMPASRMEKSSYVMDAVKAAGLDYKDLYIPKW